LFPTGANWGRLPGAIRPFCSRPAPTGDDYPGRSGRFVPNRRQLGTITQGDPAVLFPASAILGDYPGRSGRFVPNRRQLGTITQGDPAVLFPASAILGDYPGRSGRFVPNRCQQGTTPADNTGMEHWILRSWLVLVLRKIQCRQAKRVSIDS